MNRTIQSKKFFWIVFSINSFLKIDGARLTLFYLILKKLEKNTINKEGKGQLFASEFFVNMGPSF